MFEHNVLQGYRPGIYGSGLKSLAKKFQIKDGHKLIQRWYRQWNGTVESLNPKAKGSRPRTLTENEMKHNVSDFVSMMNEEFKPVNYRMVQTHIVESLNKKVPLSTIQRYGREEYGLKWKKSREITTRDSRYFNLTPRMLDYSISMLKILLNDFPSLLVDRQHWNDIAKIRRFLQRIGNNRLVFIDEMAIYSIMPPRRTLVAPEHEPLIIVQKLSAYAERYDFIGTINGSEAIACMILSPTDRKNRHTDGVTKEILNEWIVDTLAPAINRLSIDKVYLVCDRSHIHNKMDMIQALKTGKCQSVVVVCFMPTAPAKYISPSSNPIWHSIKERVRSQYPITKNNLPSLLSETFESLSKRERLRTHIANVLSYVELKFFPTNNLCE